MTSRSDRMPYCSVMHQKFHHEKITHSSDWGLALTAAEAVRLEIVDRNVAALRMVEHDLRAWQALSTWTPWQYVVRGERCQITS